MIAAQEAAEADLQKPEDILVYPVPAQPESTAEVHEEEESSEEDEDDKKPVSGRVLLKRSLTSEA